MTLLEFPGNQGQIFAVDPCHVTAVRPYRSTLPGRGAQLFDMTIVWLDERTVFVCSWSVEQTLNAVNTAVREPQLAAFEAGWAAAVSAHVFGENPSTCPEAFVAWVKGAVDE